MTIREQLERREYEYLSPYAAKSQDSKGRGTVEAECDIRPVFQRDRDRILHSKSFRRLKQKTQVFLLPKGDHYRTRLTHTLEVSQNARTVAKALRLNEDLVEAIALGHDVGHTPFGHAGERALNKVTGGNFTHNEQSVRVLDKLEKHGAGLNLTWEVLDGIVNHKTSGTPFTLEGQIVRLSDKIAYINHDIDDAIRGGIIEEADIPSDLKAVLGVSSKVRLDTMIHDVITSSMDKDRITQSAEVEAAMIELRKFMFENVYLNPKAKSEEDKAVAMITKLYEYYLLHYEILPDEYLQMLGEGESKERVVCDYIAGMTDNYAVKKFEEFFVPQAWQ
ncbi:deoxyguanosinetriphosphate triphosphohydrolase [Ohessyouella blattaphilus]|uniref:Deoxyguanosinetriphosphate triphosphohydrolase-like protein n=1 Tax=Ohessyouella blattaphilus TaxID=2949333 RepID=A0ABT1EFI3_9FIRM|nr:deoxyguanosinetriphosphate triphosphohydrolase [Ohessyouella blattaphilus]MCP1109454.1 deoxyguanosinetriphosphate triphosphohydrolase [Ohessyouella blattaphilus]MCR8562848.1 deoxyguanosinetriphosphate triphosphohydrolase [Ohessyouella blattaphilus]MDL2250954.1 deoxyguanosinetriphosphate triphosphohydrolase [Lachnospiraceae bacterium OttesenSCG-928-J05]